MFVYIYCLVGFLINKKDTHGVKEEGRKVRLFFVRCCRFFGSLVKPFNNSGIPTSNANANANANANSNEMWIQRCFN